MQGWLRTLVGWPVILTSCVSTDRAPKPQDTAAEPMGCASWQSAPPPAPAFDEAGLVPAADHVTFDDAADDILNPERGLHGDVDLMGDPDLAGVRGQGRTLVRSYVRLDAYRDAPIDPTFLDRLDHSFLPLRQAGLKVVLRFAYNFGIGQPDAPESRVLSHVDQLAPVLQRNADVIAVLQAGFIGAWGEWHHSTSGLEAPAAQKNILFALLGALPSSRMVQMRYPPGKLSMFGCTLAPTDAFTGALPSRVGHHDDCFLAGAGDTGTYPESDPEPTKDYVAAEGRFVPVGGETCAVDPPRSDCATALAELERLHWSYLNGEFMRDVLDGWQAQGCLPEIRRRLGYRLQLSDAWLNRRVAPGGIVTLRFTIKNAGYASLYNPRAVYAVLGVGPTRSTALLDGIDPRRWSGGVDATIAVRLRVPASVAPGSYRLALWLPDSDARLRDDPRYAVRLASSAGFSDADGANAIADLEVDPAAPGEVDAKAASFTVVP
jgi:hypothetical protein